MEINKPYLILEINDEKFIFLVFQYNDDLEYKNISTRIIASTGIKGGKIIDIDSSSKVLKKNITEVEKEINFTFKDITIVNTQKDYNCINISGYKNIGGSQILKEDISHLINDIKKSILNNNPNKNLIHIFNSNFFLDNSQLDNPPIGLHGEFYNHHLTFFLLPKYDLKNLQLLLNSCNLRAEKIIFKHFTQGIEKIKQIKNNKSFLLISIKKNCSSIIKFNNSSFTYAEEFSFGSDIIMKDVSKLCKLDLEIVEKIFNENSFDKIDISENICLDKKYFLKEIFRKISFSHLKNIVDARIQEIMSLVYMQNVNLKYFKQKNKNIYIIFEDNNFYNNFQLIFKKNFMQMDQITFFKPTKEDQLGSCMSTADLIGKGWHKEAISVISTKKSFISKIFTSLFS